MRAIRSIREKTVIIWKNNRNKNLASLNQSIRS